MILFVQNPRSKFWSSLHFIYFVRLADKGKDSTSKLTLKYWSKRNSQVEPRYARPESEHLAPSNIIESFNVVAFMKSEARPTGMQLKREANLLTLFGLDTKYTVCLITSSCSRFFLINYYLSLFRKNHSVKFIHLARH